MAIQNISKYIQINDFLLLEYEFSRDGTMVDISNMGATVAVTDSNVKQYFNNNKSYALGSTNNILELNSIATNVNRSNWFNNYDDTTTYYSKFTSFDASIALENNSDEYEHDTIKVHMVAGYNFDDVTGFLLQIRAQDVSDNYVDLSNFSYFKQPDALGSANVVKFTINPLYLGNRFYDKYVEFKIPSIYALGNDTFGGYDTSLGQSLQVKQLSDVYVKYSTVPTLESDSNNNTFNLVENIDFQLPVTSVADNFNVFIAESTAGDYIEYYATWADEIIGDYMGDIESGRIALYTSNNPNDNYTEFTDTYGTSAPKWTLIHELNIYENISGITGGSSLLTQKFSFSQEDNFSSANFFRPVLKNADIDASYTIQYICRLSNRMDGTQIIRRGSFASTDPKKYGLKFTRLTMENLIPYKIFNKIQNETTNVVSNTSVIRTKYTKIFYDTTNITLNENNEIFPQGTGPLFLKNGDSVYKFKFENYNSTTTKKENIDLSGAFNYGLLFLLDDNEKIQVYPTYSTNMNSTIGEFEFKLSKDQISKLLKQINNKYSIIIINPDGSNYTFYEGVYYSYNNFKSVMTNFNDLTIISGLNKTIALLETSNKKLIDENNELKLT